MRKNKEQEEEEEEEEEKEEEWRKNMSVVQVSTCWVHFARYTVLSFSFPPRSICATSSGDHCVWRELVVRVVHATQSQAVAKPCVPRPDFFHLEHVMVVRRYLLIIARNGTSLLRVEV
jgi:hypothetical protein